MLKIHMKVKELEEVRKKMSRTIPQRIAGIGIVARDNSKLEKKVIYCSFYDKLKIYCGILRLQNKKHYEISDL